MCFVKMLMLTFEDYPKSQLTTHMFILIINKFNADTGIRLAQYIFKRITFEIEVDTEQTQKSSFM